MGDEAKRGTVCNSPFGLPVVQGCLHENYTSSWMEKLDGSKKKKNVTMDGAN